MKLKTGYVISGIITGLVILFTAFSTLPDGKLHITFCDVGQGDGAYVRFPDGRDMVVDGGPNDKIIDCLGRIMPFWDRSLDLVLLTHPEKDHLQGLISVFERFKIEYFVRSNTENTSEGYKRLMELVERNHIPQKFMTQGENITVGQALLQFFGSSEGSRNEQSLVFVLRYGSFDALFPGDASLIQSISGLANETIEVLKVPHHGSKTGMTTAFVAWLHPALSIISVGKNSYGHPTQEILRMLVDNGSEVVRTDQRGNITVISDGKNWKIVDELLP